MSYEIVYVYHGDGSFLGATIYQQGAKKLHTANFWPEGEQGDLATQIDTLNNAVDIRAYWPDVRDPEVQALVNDPAWNPLELSPVEVVDEENSQFVWIEEPNDENPYGRMDEDASTIVHKIAMVPSSAAATARIRKACETVASRRAGVPLRV